MLYVSDLDGTLLNSAGALSAASRDMLAGLLAGGTRFTVASARSVHSILQVLDGVPLTLPIVELNGAFLTDPATGGHLAVNALNGAVTHGVYLQIQGAGFLPFISTFDGARDNLYHPKPTNDGMQWYYNDRVAVRDPRLRAKKRLEDVLDEQVICFTVIDRGELLVPLAQKLTGMYGSLIQLHLFRHLYCPGWSWLTVHDAHATKANALGAMRKLIGMPEEPLTVFGDDINDIAMFAHADRAIAVSNALDEVKQKAHLLISSNDEDSVARFLQTDNK